MQAALACTHRSVGSCPSVSLVDFFVDAAPAVTVQAKP